jgi:hypothetical protein
VDESPLNVQLVNVGEESVLDIPPPLMAEFPLNVQLVSVNVPALETPPPEPAEFPLKMQLVSVGAREP